MAISDVSSKSFTTELMRLSLSIIWKDAYTAYDSEPAGTTVNVEAYLAARNGELNFTTLPQFHEAVLQQFFPNTDEFLIVSGDKKYIPDEMIPDIIKAESSYIIDFFENGDGERNAYYRMLYGLPPIECTDEFLYNTKYADIPMDVPIHQLSYVDRLKLERLGYFAALRLEYTEPRYQYLEHLGKYRIFPYVARQTPPFGILYMAESTYTYLRRDLIDVYESARRMVERVYYTDAYRFRDQLFEGFLGMTILFMTQQRMHTKYLEADISRDFYDLESLKLVYDAYGMPFYSSIPLKYHTSIVKHMNELISYKGSTQVFYDIFDLFSFGEMNVFEYFLVKERNVDCDGNPIFQDIYGRPLSEEDKYKIRFSRISWRDNKYLEVSNPDNTVDYEDLTAVDPYWLEDADLRAKLYQTDWNYFQSKYMGVEIMFDISKLIFEVCYFLRMLQDTRSTNQDILAYYPPTAEDTPVFDLVIYAVALLCKNSGYTGEIPTNPSSVAAVYGFNFKEYANLLKLGSANMDDFVKSFKQLTMDYVSENAVLSLDDALQFWVDEVTDGAFSYLGDDWPHYDEPGYAPTPLFIDDFTPTGNSITNLKRYLTDTITRLKSDAALTESEIQMLYTRFMTSQGQTFRVMTGSNLSITPEYQDFVLKGANFTEEDLATLRVAITASYEQLHAWIIRLLDTRVAMTYDPHIIDIIQDMNIDDSTDIDRVYTQIEDLHQYLNVKIASERTREGFEAYANMRKILMTTTMMNSTFTKRNGLVATSYADLLLDTNPSLYYRLDNVDIDSQMEEGYVLQTLMKLCDDLVYLESGNTNNIQRVVEYMFKIIRFLKSAKVDLVDFQLIYLISDRSMNYIKLISEIYSQYVIAYGPVDRYKLMEFIHTTLVDQVISSILTLKDIDHIQNIDQFIHDAFKDLTDNVWTNVDMEIDSIIAYLVSWLRTMVVDAELRQTIAFDHASYADVDTENDSVINTKSKLLRATADAIRKSNLLLDLINKNRRVATMASTSDLTLESKANHNDVMVTASYDAMFWHDSLIKESD